MAEKKSLDSTVCTCDNLQHMVTKGVSVCITQWYGQELLLVWNKIRSSKVLYRNRDCLIETIVILFILPNVQYMSIKSHHTVTVITLVSIVEWLLLWCIIDKYTNYCQNYCWTTVVWKWNYLVITVLYGDFLLTCTV